MLRRVKDQWVLLAAISIFLLLLTACNPHITKRDISEITPVYIDLSYGSDSTRVLVAEVPCGEPPKPTCVPPPPPRTTILRATESLKINCSAKPIVRVRIDSLRNIVTYEIKATFEISPKK